MEKLLLAICVFFVTSIYSQDSLTIFIGADQNVSEVLTPKKIYKYPGFKPGKIFFKDGSFANGTFNYNYLNGEIEFAQQDTLALAKEQMLNIKVLTLDRDSFFYDKGYLQQILQTPFGRLLKKQMLVITKREKIGGYNQPNPASAIESYGSFTDNYGVFTPNLKIHENITLILRTDFYFGDRFNTFLPANKRNLLKLYPNKKSQIDEYLRTHTVNFKNAEDLRNLLTSLH